MADTVEFQNAPENEEKVDKLNVQQQVTAKTAQDWVRDMRMSASVNKTTLGVESDRVTPDVMLAASSKLLKLNRREVEPDPKDSLEFQRVYGPAEYFSEHILKDANRLGRQLLWKATNKGNLDFMPTAALDQHVSDVFNSSKMANMVDGSSPLELVEAAHKVSRIGEGGIADISSAPDEMRLVQPSFLGFIDPVRSVESLRVGLDSYLTKHCMKGSDGKLYQKFINARTGKEELVDSVTIAKSVVTTPEMMDAKTKYVTAVGGKTGVRIVKKSDIDYYLPRMDDAFTTASNLVTGMSGVKELRLLMGCLHPMTSVVTISKRNMVDVTAAKDMGEGAHSIPGADDDGKSVMYPIVGTYSKFPQQRNWFRKVVLLSGRTLLTSKDHRWSVMRNDRIQLVTADKLKKGDKVLRSLFHDIPNRRTFVLDTLVNKDIALLLGYMTRTLERTSQDKHRICFEERHREQLSRAFEKLKIDDVSEYKLNGRWYKAWSDPLFMAWAYTAIGTTWETRKVPSEILSANAVIVAAFMDGYTADETRMGEDSAECSWILDIDNTLQRDGLNVLLNKLGVDCYYRDGRRDDGKMSLALKLIDLDTDFGDFAIDVVKDVVMTKNPPYMVDIDIDDNLYAVANGIVTHNSKYPQQAVSITGREAPLVRGLDEMTGKDMQSTIGSYLGARYARKPGTITAVRKDRIDMLYDDGTKGSVALYVNFPMNAKGYITNAPQVKAGMHVGKGDLLASSNYTDDKGVMATGTNLRTGWISWKGGTYEDAIVLSESAAKKLTSTTMYNTALDLDKTVTLGKRNYLSWKPGEYTKEQLSILDDDGIVRPGTVLQKGDPMVLAVQTTEPSPGTMGKRVLTDVSETWEHDHPGVVTDIIRTRKGVKVLATVTAPLEEGDKVSGCFDDDTEIFTKRGFVNFNELEYGEPVAVLGEDGTAHWEVPYDYMNYRVDGKLYSYSDRLLDFRVTGNHRMLFISKHDYEETGSRALSICTADELGTKAYYVSTAAHFDRDIETFSTVTNIPRRVNSCARKYYETAFRTSDFAAFLGIWLAEGHVGKGGNIDCVYITQSRTVHSGICARIEKLLTDMKLDWTYAENRRFVIRNPHLHDYLQTFGHAQDKFIPDYVFNTWSDADCRTLLEWHYMGDGDKTGTTNRVATVSYRLARDLQRLHILLGDSCTCSYNDSVIDRHEQTGEDVGRNFRRYRVTQQAHTYHIVNKTHKAAFTEYHGFVHCVSTKSGKILVCRNGKIMWCGNCYGNKGVVSHVLPDDQMPCDKNGKPLEMLLSPLGLVSRCNPAQLTEALLGKVAHKTGKHEVLPSFYPGDMKQYISDKLKQAHITPEDSFWDPETGREIKGVVNGYSYIHKLKHLSESKMTARGTGAYSSDETPGGAGYDAAKRYGTLEISAMTGHGAFDNLLDVKLLRGQSNSDFWRELRTGGIPTIPGEPLVQRKWFAHLQGSGINVRKTPKGISVFALSRNDVNQLAGPREVKSRDTYEAKNFRPIDGGLFGQDVFGINGDKWGYIQLDSPMPNPVMEEPLARLLRVSDKDFRAAAEGHGPEGLENPSAIRDRLSKLDVDAEAKQAMKEFKEATASKKDNALKRYVAIERMRRQGIRPEEYMLDRIPVLPPQFRPVTSHSGLTMVADANYLYAQLLDARDDVREAKNLPKEYQDKAATNLYRTWQELVGMYDPEDVKLKNKNVGGLLQWALGKGSPKFSAAQRKVIGATVDTVGRGVIVPNSRITVDQIGVPVKMAMDMMAPFVERALVKRGYSPIDAMKMVKKRDKQAMDVLQEVVKTHPVEMNRAPTLHKFSIMAFEPVLVNGNAIQIHPSVCPGFGADFDGDTVNLHVPISDAARKEAMDKMRPSRMLMTLSNHKTMFKPEKEYMQGLYIATRMGKTPDGRARIFRTMQEAKDAYRSGAIDIDTPIQILEK